MEMTMENLSPVVRYRRRVEAEVARAHLESAGLECEILERDGGQTEVLVSSMDASMATRILGTDRRTAERRASTTAGRRSLACPDCRGRHVKGQGRMFWILLVGLVAMMIPIALNASYSTLVIVSVVNVLILASVDLIFKDWRCVRCGKRWRG
jgi:hypothetical protein